MRKFLHAYFTWRNKKVIPSVVDFVDLHVLHTFYYENTLSKYIENFTKTESLDKNSGFHITAQDRLCTLQKRLGEAVRTSTKNLCF